MTDPSIHYPRLLDGSAGHAEYLDCVAGLSDEAKECLWLLAKVRLSLRARQATPRATLDPAWPGSVPRVAGDELSVEDFREKYLRPGLPVVVTGLLKEVLPGGAQWSIERIRELLCSLCFVNFLPFFICHVFYTYVG